MSGHESIEAEIERLLTGGSTGSAPSGLEAALEGIRSELRAIEPPPVHAALSEFVDAGLIVDKGDLLATAASNAPGPATPQVAELPKRRVTSHERKQRRVLTTVSTFVATITGKIVVGTTVALAATTGAHAVGVVDVPVLPDTETENVVDEDVLDDDTTVGDADGTGATEDAASSGSSGDPSEGDAGTGDPTGDDTVLVGHDDELVASDDDDDDDDDAWEACSDQADAIRDAAEGLGDRAEDDADRAQTAPKPTAKPNSPPRAPKPTAKPNSTTTSAMRPRMSARPNGNARRNDASGPRSAVRSSANAKRRSAKSAASVRRNAAKPSANARRGARAPGGRARAGRGAP